MQYSGTTSEAVEARGVTLAAFNAVDIDIQIGETAALGRGVGPRALDMLACKLQRDPMRQRCTSVGLVQ